MNRIESEKKTMLQMVKIYCHGHHHNGHDLCESCRELVEYAYARLDHCKFGEHKTTCKKCPIHCYKPAMREQMRQVMRYAGPHMMWHHPWAAILHLIREM